MREALSGARPSATLLALLICSAASAAEPASTESPAAEKPRPPDAPPAVELPGVEVHGPRDPLAGADARLKALQQKLPDPANGSRPKDTLGQRARAAIETYVHTPHDINQLPAENLRSIESMVDPLGHHERDALRPPEPADYRDALQQIDIGAH